MHISERLGNFELLRERLGKAEDKTALPQLEIIRIQALNEFRDLTKLGKTITVDGQTFDAVRRHSMSVEERERLVFSLGWECMKGGAKMAARDNFLDVDITLHHLDILPNCAMLHVLAMIENITDGEGKPQIITPRLNFILTDDVEKVFQDLISTRLPIFYPEITIGKIKTGLSTNGDVSETDEKDAKNLAMVLSIIEAQKEQHDKKIADVENDAKLLSDTELLAIFTEYFDFGMKEGFLLQPGSPRYKAYFDVVNAATLEMLNNPQLYQKVTKREHSDLVAMYNNRIPGVTNSLLCGLIFCMGKYAVVPSATLCVDFAEAIPNCIAVYLLLTAQKLPFDSRKQVIDAGDRTNPQPLKAAMDKLSICAPIWEYHIFPNDDDNKSENDATLPDGFRKELLTSQLLARYHFLKDNESLEEFNRRMSACGISKEKADAFMQSEIEIISESDKKFLADPKYIMGWAFPLDKLYLSENPKKYLLEKEFTVSEISKIFDEINWHSNNSRNRELANGVWDQICKFSSSGEEPFLNVAVTILATHGWSFEEAHRFLYNEDKLILHVRWGIKKDQMPFTPGFDNPYNIKNPPAVKKKKPIVLMVVVALLAAIVAFVVISVIVHQLEADPPSGEILLIDEANINETVADTELQALDAVDASQLLGSWILVESSIPVQAEELQQGFRYEWNFHYIDEVKFGEFIIFDLYGEVAVFAPFSWSVSNGVLTADWDGDYYGLSEHSYSMSGHRVTIINLYDGAIQVFERRFGATNDYNQLDTTPVDTSTDNPLVGTWLQGLGLTGVFEEIFYVFNADGSGVKNIFTRSYNFTWEVVENNKLRIIYDDDALGEDMESIRIFAIDGDELTLGGTRYIRAGVIGEFIGTLEGDGFRIQILHGWQEVSPGVIAPDFGLGRVFLLSGFTPFEDLEERVQYIARRNEDRLNDYREIEISLMQIGSYNGIMYNYKHLHDNGVVHILYYFIVIKNNIEYSIVYMTAHSEILQDFNFDDVLKMVSSIEIDD